MHIRFSNQQHVFRIHTDQIPYLSFQSLDALGVPNLYSTRFLSYDEAAGTGEPGLRLAVMKGEAMEEAAPHTLGMRDQLARQLGSSIAQECVTDQKHTNHVYVVTPEDLGPVWPEERPARRLCVDGLVTDLPGALLTAFGGDCPPVYLADPVRHAVGLVHAGWKGTLGKIPAVAIALMTERFGTDPADLHAAIGPGVCKDCYEMGEEVVEMFASEWGKACIPRLFSWYPATDENGQPIPGGKPHLDLREANSMTLCESGVPDAQISVSNVCTMCNADTFYSYRAHRMENEQAAMIVNRFGG